MPIRHAQAQWQGTLKEGAGTLKLESGAFEGPYTWADRFADGGPTLDADVQVPSSGAGEGERHCRAVGGAGPGGRRGGGQRSAAADPGRRLSKGGGATGGDRDHRGRRGLSGVRRGSQGQVPGIEGAGRRAGDRAERAVG